MMEFAKESIEAAREVCELAGEHFYEVAAFDDEVCRPDMAAYAACEASGALRVYTARDKGRLVGYAIYNVTREHHFGDSIRATQDAIYLMPEYRKGSAGYRFVKWCDEQLRADGVDTVYQYEPMTRRIGSIFQRLGYEAIQVLWARRFCDGR
jgi:GNAT superfamily N-acetyltransferase